MRREKKTYQKPFVHSRKPDIPSQDKAKHRRGDIQNPGGHLDEHMQPERQPAGQYPQQDSTQREQDHERDARQETVEPPPGHGRRDVEAEPAKESSQTKHTIVSISVSISVTEAAEITAVESAEVAELGEGRGG